MYLSRVPLGSYGHIPNGGRVYYLQRSQPPLLTLMMDRYVAHTKDVTFLQWVPCLAGLHTYPMLETPQGQGQ